jgi:hypothetical protein
MIKYSSGEHRPNNLLLPEKYTQGVLSASTTGETFARNLCTKVDEQLGDVCDISDHALQTSVSFFANKTKVQW